MPVAHPDPDAPRPPASAGRPRGALVGRLRGTPLIVAPTWVVSIVLLVVLGTRALGFLLPGWPLPWRLGAAVATTLALVGAVVLHELAHGEAGRALGRPPSWYVLTFIGGYTAFPRTGETPRTSALVTLAGPATNAVLGGACALGAWALAPSWAGGALAWQPGVAGLALVTLGVGAFTNLALGAFNLLPGLPLDGGKLVEAAVWRATGSRARGTLWAALAGLALAACGVAAALALPAAGVVRLSALSVLLALVVLGQLAWVAGAQARSARRWLRAEGLVLGELAEPVDVLPAHHTLADLDALRRERGTARPVVVRRPGGVALLDEQAALAVTGDARAARTVGELATAVPAAGMLRDARGAAAVAAVERAQGAGPTLVLLAARPVAVPPDGPGGEEGAGDRARILGVLDVAAVARALDGRPPR